MHFTHYFIDPTEPRRATLCNVSECEACGCRMEAANAVSALVNLPAFRRLGLFALPARLPDGGWCDEIGGEACHACCAKYSNADA